MASERARWPGSVSRRALLTSGVILALAAGFAYATYLSYGAGIDISSAFNYQSAVVSAQRDAELLEVEQFDRNLPPQALRLYEKLLDTDLERVARLAQTRAQLPPTFRLPATRASYAQLADELGDLEERGRDRFDATSRWNTRTRDLSNALFVIVSLFFAVFVGRLRESVEEGRSLVERLQRAFISKRRAVPNVDVGSILISATRGSNVGGDVYDVFTYDNRHVMFFVGDVSGKGIEAAVDTALIKYSLRTLFASERDPGAMLERFSRVYDRSAGSPENFVVVFLAVLDTSDGTLRYASAGHEPAWLITGGVVTRLEPTGPIIGVTPAPAYATRALELRALDTLVVTTDGVTESRDRQGRLLGADNVALWLAQLRGTAQSMANGIVDRIKRRSRSIEDDLGILVVRYAPNAATVRAAAERAVLERRRERSAS